MYWLCWVFIAVQAFLQLLGGGYDPVGVLGLLAEVAALVAGHGLWVPALKGLWLPELLSAGSVVVVQGLSGPEDVGSS